MPTELGTINIPTTVPENCIDCPLHRIISDPDPHDWFCDDDVAVVCSHPDTPPRKAKADDPSPYERQTMKAVTVACRPYNTRKESSTPSWCPLRSILVTTGGNAVDQK